MSQPSTVYASGADLLASPKMSDSSFDSHDSTYSVSESDSAADDTLDSVPDSPDVTSADVTIDENGHLALKEADLGPHSSAASKEAVSAAAVTWTQFLMKHEIPRKVFHSFQGVPSLYLFVTDIDHHQIAYPLWAAFVALATVEYLRLHNETFNNWLLPWVKYIVRERERATCNGTVYYMAGCASVLTFASRDVSIVSILLLSWADTAASTFGRAYGRYTPQIAKGKSLAGSLASAATGMLVTWLVYGVIIPRYAHLSAGSDILWTPQTSRLSLPLFALATGVVTAVAEAIDVLGLDDNFTIPVLCSMFMTATIRVFQK